MYSRMYALGLLLTGPLLTHPAVLTSPVLTGELTAGVLTGATVLTASVLTGRLLAGLALLAGGGFALTGRSASTEARIRPGHALERLQRASLAQEQAISRQSFAQAQADRVPRVRRRSPSKQRTRQEPGWGRGSKR